MSYHIRVFLQPGWKLNADVSATQPARLVLPLEDARELIRQLSDLVAMVDSPVDSAQDA